MEKNDNLLADEALDAASTESTCGYCGRSLRPWDVFVRLPCQHTGHEECAIEQVKQNGVSKCNIDDQHFKLDDLAVWVSWSIPQDDKEQTSSHRSNYKNALRKLRLLEAKASRMEYTLFHFLNKSHLSYNDNLMRQILKKKTAAISERYTYLIRISMLRAIEEQRNVAIASSGSSHSVSPQKLAQRSSMGSRRGSTKLGYKNAPGLTRLRPDRLQSKVSQDEESRSGNYVYASHRDHCERAFHRPLVFTATLRNISPRSQLAISAQENQSNTNLGSCRASGSSTFDVLEMAQIIDEKNYQTDSTTRPVETDNTEADDNEDEFADRQVISQKRVDDTLTAARGETILGYEFTGQNEF